jgi:6-phosphogluconolactonase
MSGADVAGAVRPMLLLADGPGGVADVAADLLVAWLAGAIGRHGEANVALTGGSSARGLYAALREPRRATAIDWGAVHAWMGDERLVRLDDPESNGGMALRELVADGAGPLPAANLHLVPVDQALAEGRGAEAAAGRYADAIRAAVRMRGAVPAFDVVLLGIGGDGHLLSVFPGSPALAPDAPLAMAIAAPTHIGPHVARVTLSPAILETAERILPMVSGAAKAEVVARILGAERDPARWPAQLAVRPNATWVLDPAAAAGIRPG